MTKPTKTLDELVTIFNSALLHDIEFVRVRKDFVVALIADRKRLLDEVERLKTAYELQIGDLGEELKK